MFGTNIVFPLGPSISLVMAIVLLFKLELPKNFFKTIITLILSLFIFNLGLYAAGFYWIPHTLYEFGNVPNY